MRARQFLFGSLGVLALAWAFHLGATSAGAQSGALVDAGVTYPESQGPFGIAAVIGRTFYYNSVPVGPPLPGTAKAISMAQCGNCGDTPDFVVMLDNGDMWHILGAGSGWVYYGNAIGAAGPTPVHATTFGALKVHYR
jgi:hypothetical protein